MCVIKINGDTLRQLKNQHGTKSLNDVIWEDSLNIIFFRILK